MSEQPPTSELVYDWEHGRQRLPAPRARGRVRRRDAARRAAVALVRDPDIETKLRLLHLMERLGIHTLDIGCRAPGRARAPDILALCEEIVRQKDAHHAELRGGT